MTVIEMCTGSPPWPNPAHAVYKICMTEDLPPFPDGLSPEGQDFLRRVRGAACQRRARLLTESSTCVCVVADAQCFVRDPDGRADTTELLNHAFLDDPSDPKMFRRTRRRPDGDDGDDAGGGGDGRRRRGGGEDDADGSSSDDDVVLPRRAAGGGGKLDDDDGEHLPTLAPPETATWQREAAVAAGAAAHDGDGGGGGGGVGGDSVGRGGGVARDGGRSGEVGRAPGARPQFSASQRLGGGGSGGGGSARDVLFMSNF
jgi:hypothetical protein